MKSHRSNIGDKVIHAVLDGIFHVTGIDPSIISPDDDLIKDLECSESLVHSALEHAARHLQIQNLSFFKSLNPPRTPRQMVDILRQLGEKSEPLAG